jgi:hypothetical protein
LRVSDAEAVRILLPSTERALARTWAPNLRNGLKAMISSYAALMGARKKKGAEAPIKC